MAAPSEWPEQVFDLLVQAKVQQVGVVPDAGHATLITQVEHSPSMTLVPLTTEEEGIGLLAGAWLGGQRGVLLLQSSGVGNCVNSLALATEGRFPLLLLVTMRGDEGEFNAMQVPMGQSTRNVLEDVGVIVYRADAAAEVATTIEHALKITFNTHRAVAVLIGQSVIGAKDFRRLTRVGEQE
ncbi:MAG: thiamine pyrophosphate-binding protein [Beutenbergiaceae bacterium]